VEIQTSTGTYLSCVAAETGTWSAYSSQHEVRIAHVFGTGVLAEEIFPYAKAGEGSESDGDVAGARAIGSHSACGTAVEEMVNESRANVTGIVGDLWAEVEVNDVP
jgi:hypothetical protein